MGVSCGLIGFNAGKLTRVDSRMKVILKGLPDKLRGVAWPSSARTLRRAVKSVNERDPRHHLLSYCKFLRTEYMSTMMGPLVINQRKEWATVGQYGPDILGYTRPAMARTKRCDTER